MPKSIVGKYVVFGHLCVLSDREAGAIMPRSQLIDIACKVVGETDKAWRINDGTKVEWLPKSQVENNGDGTFTIPEWLAKEKGFI
jgi:hypothetical protein